MPPEMRGDKWVELGNHVIARYEKGGETFEILVEPNKAYEFRRGVKISLDEILEGFIIFEDLKHGKKASPESMERVFGTKDPLIIAEKILKEGSLQLTADQRKKMIEEKKKRIISIIAKNCVNPQTKLPHPPQRIERGIEEAKIQIDPWKNPEEQAKDIVKKLQEVMPIRMEIASFEVNIPAAFSGKAYNIVSQFGNIVKESWGADGSWNGVVEVPGGMQTVFIDALNKATKGAAMVKKKQ
ncbi:MAG: ribosome assembly factor SBDS [Candidatus Odinarchaeum yellowstonii]|uniref:Ribosome assembly factor SBDS n=1 Tax=Odinarchaeota yellowstonii (strain LCB_4) TaxID=1841599 RepID=A0AAF0D167_ODILC|nr:MAG: ribosome assembly factor SBDS [Candidatus Odinarchaeum yellowstonii]